MNNSNIPAFSNKTILYCVLNWGLGHATRSIPLIQEYAKKNKVIIASDGNALNLLKQELPDFSFIEFPSFNISYKSKYMLVNLIRIFFQILNSAKQNNYFLEAIEKRLPLDVIISDNRFGCWSKKTTSIYITHQVMIKLPNYLKMFERLGFWFHAQMIKKFNECWIPDFEGKENLSGDLSHKYKLKIPAKFIGPLSRFEPADEDISYEFDFCIILSGPEPNRTNLEKIILEKFSGIPQKSLVVRGTPKDNMQFGYGNLQVYSHLPTSVLNQKIRASKHIITRAGYTSIMDIVVLNRKALIIPTPEQPEQEFLAKHIDGKNNLIAISEADFKNRSIEEILKLLEN